VSKEFEETIRFEREDLIDRVPDPGWYRLAVAGVWKRPVETTANLAVKVKFEVTEPGDYEGVELWDQYVVVGAPDNGDAAFGTLVARRRLARLMRAAGIAVRAKVNLSLKALEGCEFEGKIMPEEFQGQLRARFKGVRPLNGRSVPDVDRVTAGAPEEGTDPTGLKGGETPF
jgi:hypothetical protein